ncbi:MAG: DUF87 domain-containing protein [Bacilli bacterium]|nr:DUF87 domain-containing protein [Bacilli bacterium]
MLGNIISIEENSVIIKLAIDVSTQANLINVHVVFEDGEKKIVGEIVNIGIDTAKISIVGEIDNNNFIPGVTKKPAFKSSIRIITMDELALLLGEQQITNNDQIYLGKSSIYKNYRINVGVNSFFSNHFAILGNTGSGKSCTVSRLLQNMFTSNSYLPVNANIFIFDAYGEYTNAFSKVSEISPALNYKTYTTNSLKPDGELLRIPLWLLGIDDIALLLDASDPAQLSIIEKALKLVPILRKTSYIQGDNPEVIRYRNDIVARALLDILRSGKDSSKIRDQIIAILTTYQTRDLNLESRIVQPGYVRTLRQCLYVDKSGKMQEMELVVDFISTFIVEGLEIPSPNGQIPYTLKDLELALDFALISEGVLKSDKVFDYANVLSVRLHTLINSDYAIFFDYNEMIDRKSYIAKLLTAANGRKAQIVNFNINYVNDRMAKTLTKIISKMLFDFATEMGERGTIPFHILIEEAHRYVQMDRDQQLLGYNIFDRITKEGRKYGVILGLITQRPSELSDTSISQCSNFIILRTLHPKDLAYIKEMVPNVSEEIVAHLKTLQPGNAIAFGSAFKVPVDVQIDKPNPEPLSSNSNISKIWFG